jgi:hypothetical protein
VKSAQVNFLEVPSDVLNVPPDIKKFPAQVKSYVAILMVPLVIVRLFMFALALMNLPGPDIEIVDVP